MKENSNLFLKKKYDLHNAPEVKKQAERAEARTGEKVPQDPSSRIQNYLDRFKEITDRKDPAERERGLEAIKRVLYRDNIIKPKDIPRSYWETQRRLAREQGHGDIEITGQLREQQAEVIIADQKSSLDTWVDYLSSSDAPFPDWLKYWAIRSILGMGEYDKEKKEFTKRSKGTVKPFPDLNREALAYILDTIEAKYEKRIINLSEELGKLVKEENFAKLYAWAIEKVTPASVDQLTTTQGAWKKYPRGSDHAPLVESLQGHGTGWCTAGESTAQTQLEAGDFYVYYSLNQNGQPIVPRVAIRMQEDHIAEVRGIAEEQNLDPHIGEVVQKKMQEFPDGKEYEKKAGDMKLLTAIDNKMKAGEELFKDELVFLYEINNPIEGFGYEKDPRVKELRDQRDYWLDLPIIFDCLPEEIAWDKKAIDQNTKAYIGRLFPGIFKKFGHLEHIYTSFPEGKIRRETIEIGGKDAKQLEAELEKSGFQINDYAKFMMNSKDFKTEKKPEPADLVRLKVRDLFSDKYPTTNELYKKAQDMGLELCPPEVGPHLRLNYKNQPLNEWFRIAMKQITDPPGGAPGVFDLGCDGDGVWLGGSWAKPGFQWDPEEEFVFQLSRK